jgi:superoxide dismutase
MRYQLAPLYCRPWTLNGISARLIESHYENNYGAALSRLNVISEEIEQLDLGRTADQTLVRLKRDEVAALNSTLLHELYFASLGGDGRVVPDAVGSAIANDFGSVDRWRQEFVSIANGLAGGSGWVLLTPIIWNSARMRALTSPLSCATSIGPQSRCDMRMPSRSRHPVLSNKSSSLTSPRSPSKKSVRC